MSTIGQRFRDCRIAAGMSVDELAERIGKNRATVYRYEKGEIEDVPTQVIGQLAEIFGVSPGFLMGWEEKAAPEDGSGLSDKDIRLLTWFRSLPEEKQRAILIAQDAPEELF